MAHLNARAKDGFVDFDERGFNYEKFDISVYARRGGEIWFQDAWSGMPAELGYYYDETSTVSGSVVAYGLTLQQSGSKPPTGTVTEIRQHSTEVVFGRILTIEDFEIAADLVHKAINTRGTDDDAVLLEMALSGDDLIELTWEWDRARGFRGHDVMWGDDGWDVLFGDAGNDTLQGGEGGDELWGGSGHDQLVGGIEDSFNENDTLDGGGGDDTLTGATGEDVLRGGDGADLLAGGSDADVMIGGGGDDVYEVDRAADLVMEFLPGRTDPGGVDEVRSMVNWVLDPAFEHLTLQGEARVGTGNAVANTITGNSQRNDLDGLGGNDTLLGGEGGDWLAGGGGGDLVAGGSGADVIEVTSRVGTGSDSRARVVAGSSNDVGADTLEGFDFSRDVILVRATGVASFVHGRDTEAGAGRGIEQAGTIAAFSASAGLIELNQLNDRQWLDAGDIVLTFASHHTPLTEAGFEASLQYELQGTFGDDTLAGGARDDRLGGLAGADVLTGGGGRDVFVFEDADDAVMGDRLETIKDFTRGEDKIDLRGIDANVVGSGNQAFEGTLIAGSTIFSVPGQLRVDDGVLYGNTDLDEFAEFAIALPGVTSLSAADFVL